MDHSLLRNSLAVSAVSILIGLICSLTGDKLRYLFTVVGNLATAGGQ